MRKLLLFIFILTTLYLILNTSTMAQSATPAASQTPTPTTKNNLGDLDLINNLKTRIASRVAQLNLVERRGVIGIVTEISDTKITLSDFKDENRFIDVDELTKFSSPTNKESFGISDISKGAKIGALGLYNKQSRRVLARFINILIMPVSIHGTVLSIDRDNYTLTVMSANGKKSLIDIETTTRTSLYTKENGLTKSGFSKIRENERVIVMGFKDDEDKDRYLASRILVFPQLPNDPRINIPQSNTTEEVAPTTGSGKK